MDKNGFVPAPYVVIEAIQKTFPKESDDILSTLRYHGGIDKTYSFNRWGMFVGVELDGYIHT